MVILDKSFWSSAQSAFMESYCSRVRYCALYKSSNQYAVSADSLKAMYILARKSFRLQAQFASAMFAPMLVPLRNNCFDNINSFFSSQRYLYNAIILKAKFLLFSKTTLSIPNSSFLIPNYQKADQFKVVKPFDFVCQEADLPAAQEAVNVALVLYLDD